MSSSIKIMSTWWQPRLVRKINWHNFQLSFRHSYCVKDKYLMNYKKIYTNFVSYDLLVGNKLLIVRFHYRVLRVFSAHQFIQLKYFSWNGKRLLIDRFQYTVLRIFSTHQFIQLKNVYEMVFRPLIKQTICFDFWNFHE